eukprot:GHVL01004212.1.p1 GENE.GHVL01004212.1~~GHVL01004212.1.p1  ORF type:complete len:126 (+),score=1.81 GHVL01004212.1:151-528(+)
MGSHIFTMFVPQVESFSSWELSKSKLLFETIKRPQISYLISLFSRCFITVNELHLTLIFTSYLAEEARVNFVYIELKEKHIRCAPCSFLKTGLSHVFFVQHLLLLAFAHKNHCKSDLGFSRSEVF